MFFPEIEEPQNVKILIVDDDRSILKNLEEILSSDGYKVYTAENGKDALEKLFEIEPDIMLIDFLIPEIDGISLCKIIKNNPETVDIGVILITAANDLNTRVKGLASGADDFLNKPFFIPELKARIISLSKMKKYRDFLKNYQNVLEKEVEKKTTELQKIYLELQIAYNEIKDLSLEIIHRLAKAAESRDKYTGFHIQRISFYSTKIAEHLGLSKDKIELIKYGSPLHDIGKLSIPDNILLKPGPLHPKEWEIMKMHTVIGAKILEGSKIKYLKAAEKIALLHHERWDGTGYPYGLKGKKIPLFARIVSIADVFDALTSDRPYRKALPVDTAFEIIKNEAGRHFDPELVEIFLKIKDEIIELRELFKDENGPNFTD
ncbi:MAG: Response regulator c-di-GMP phosphodiesterase [Thermodesulfobacteria bacterium]|nr:two-component system response regulator [Thermodesulfobacteriota bacterium]MCU4137722.1 Response regulator c-di-GMP phosphodiesterase [Thermodesulfobacteriota bacterium]